jgi:Holliday junction resolvase
MPKHTHDIGKREERQIVKDLEKLGYRARRQPGSGNRAVDLQHDVLWHDSPDGKKHIESKFRSDQKGDGARSRSGIANLLSWMDGADILCVRQSRGPRYAFLEWDLLLRLVGEAVQRDEMAISADSDRAVRHDLWNALLESDKRRDRIQSAHQNPPQKPKQPRKLKGRGFSKRKEKIDGR